MRTLLNFFFHHFYHAFAWTYDLVAAIVSVGRWNDWVRACLPYLHGPRVLEIGFGPGHLQMAMNELGLQVFGLDESMQMIRQARANLRQHGFQAALSRGYTQFLPFEGNSFDSVVSTFPSEYIVDQWTLDEILRVLVPGGRLVVVPTAWIGGSSLPDRGARGLFRVTHQGVEITTGLENRLRSVFTAAGFEVEIIRVEIRQSAVLIVIAKKPSG